MFIFKSSTSVLRRMLITPIYADFHNHTTFSSDSTTSPKILVEALKAHPYIKAAAITDHDTIAGLKETQQLAASYPTS